MESNGILSTRTRAYWKLLPSPPIWTLGILAAVGRVEHLKPLDLVTGRSRGRAHSLPRTSAAGRGLGACACAHR